MTEEFSYTDQLRDPRWIERREEILRRDDRLCQLCMSGKHLNVHHRYYVVGRMAWEYPDAALVTLCRECHQLEHLVTKIKRLPANDNIVEAGERLQRDIGLLKGLIARMNGKKVH